MKERTIALLIILALLLVISALIVLMTTRRLPGVELVSVTTHMTSIPLGDFLLQQVEISGSTGQALLVPSPWAQPLLGTDPLPVQVRSEDGIYTALLGLDRRSLTDDLLLTDLSLTIGPLGQMEGTAHLAWNALPGQALGLTEKGVPVRIRADAFGDLTLVADELPPLTMPGAQVQPTRLSLTYRPASGQWEPAGHGTLTLQPIHGLGGEYDVRLIAEARQVAWQVLTLPPSLTLGAARFAFERLTVRFTPAVGEQKAGGWTLEGEGILSWDSVLIRRVPVRLALGQVDDRWQIILTASPGTTLPLSPLLTLELSTFSVRYDGTLDLLGEGCILYHPRFAPYFGNVEDPASGVRFSMRLDEWGNPLLEVAREDIFLQVEGLEEVTWEGMQLRTMPNLPGTVVMKWQGRGPLRLSPEVTLDMESFTVTVIVLLSESGAPVVALPGGQGRGMAEMAGLQVRAGQAAFVTTPAEQEALLRELTLAKLVAGPGVPLRLRWQDCRLTSDAPGWSALVPTEDHALDFPDVELARMVTPQDVPDPLYGMRALADEVRAQSGFSAGLLLAGYPAAVTYRFRPEGGLAIATSLDVLGTPAAFSGYLTPEGDFHVTGQPATDIVLDGLALPQEHTTLTLRPDGLYLRAETDLGAGPVVFTGTLTTDGRYDLSGHGPLIMEGFRFADAHLSYRSGQGLVATGHLDSPLLEGVTLSFTALEPPYHLASFGAARGQLTIPDLTIQWQEDDQWHQDTVPGWTQELDMVYMDGALHQGFRHLIRETERAVELELVPTGLDVILHCSDPVGRQVVSLDSWEAPCQPRARRPFVVTAFRDAFGRLQVAALENRAFGDSPILRFRDAWWGEEAGYREDVAWVSVAPGELDGDDDNGQEVAVVFRDSRGYLHLVVLREDGCLELAYAWYDGDTDVGHEEGRDDISYLDATAADVDGDGRDEVVCAFRDRLGRLQIDTFDAEEPIALKGAWWSADHERDDVYDVSVTAADVDGDGRPEIIGAFRDGTGRLQVITLDAEGPPELREVWADGDSEKGRDDVYHVSVAAADLDDDEEAEIVCAFRDAVGWLQMVVLDATPVLTLTDEWGDASSGRDDVAHVSLTLGDLENDGLKEAAVGFRDAQGRLEVIILDTIDALLSLRSEWSDGQWPDGRNAGRDDVSDVSLTTADLDDDGRAEVLVALRDRRGYLQLVALDAEETLVPADDWWDAHRFLGEQAGRDGVSYVGVGVGW